MGLGYTHAIHTPRTLHFNRVKTHEFPSFWSLKKSRDIHVQHCLEVTGFIKTTVLFKFRIFVDFDVASPRVFLHMTQLKR